MRLNLKQALLESTLGQIKRAAKEHGDTPKATELWRLALAVKQLRDPEVAEAYEAERLKRVQRQAGARA